MRRALAGSLVLAFAITAGCGDGGGGGGTGSVESFCDQMRELEEKYGEDVFGDSSSFDPTNTDVFNELLDDLRDVNPPSAIADDWNDVLEALEFFAEAFEDLDFNDPEALAELEELSAEIEERTGDIEAKGQRIDEFLQEECDISTG